MAARSASMWTIRSAMWCRSAVSASRRSAARKRVPVAPIQGDRRFGASVPFSVHAELEHFLAHEMLDLALQFQERRAHTVARIGQVDLEDALHGAGPRRHHDDAVREEERFRDAV